MADKISIYQPLERQSRQVRLMRMQHADRLDEINCYLEVVSLESQPDYVGLSYCWTKEPPTRRIQLNGQPFFVRPNLHEYLKLMREEHQTDLVFVDAICINQEDEAEISNQISLMKMIYWGAREVVAWLGIGDYFPDQCVLVLPRVQELCSSEEGIKSIMDDSNMTAVFIHAFLDFKYWSRLWIMQEIILARVLGFRFRNIQVPSHLFWYFLSHKINMLRAYDLVTNGRLPLIFAYDQTPQKRLGQRFRQKGSLIPDVSRLTQCGILAEIFLQQRDHWQYDTTKPHDIPIANAVNMSVAQDCAKLHDTIFGLLALTKSFIVPDYQTSITELYIRVLIEGLVNIAPSIGSTNPRKSGSLDTWVNILGFVSSLLYKLRLVPWHSTTALITLEVLKLRCSGISEEGRYNALKFCSRKEACRSDYGFPLFRYRRMRLELRQCQRENRIMPPPRLHKSAESSDCAKTYQEWIKMVDDISQDLHSRSQSHTPIS